jgi:hypothetical protein
MIRNISGDNGACSDKGILADGVSVDDGAVDTQGCAAFEVGHGKFLNKAMGYGSSFVDSLFKQTQSFLFLLSGIFVSTLTKPE